MNAPTLFDTKSADKTRTQPQEEPSKASQDKQVKNTPKAAEAQQKPASKTEPQEEQGKASHASQEKISLKATEAQQTRASVPNATDDLLTLAEAAREVGWVAVRLTQPKIKAVLEERGAIFGKGRGGSLIPRSALAGLNEQFPVRPRAKNGTPSGKPSHDSEVAVLAQQVERLEARVDEARQIVRDETSVLKAKKRELALLVKKRRKNAEEAFEHAKAELELITSLNEA